MRTCLKTKIFQYIFTTEVSASVLLLFSKHLKDFAFISLAYQRKLNHSSQKAFKKWEFMKKTKQNPVPGSERVAFKILKSLIFSFSLISPLECQERSIYVNQHCMDLSQCMGNGIMERSNENI